MARAAHSRRSRAGGTTAARRAFQCRVADLVDASAPAMNELQLIPVIRDSAARGAMFERQAIPVIADAGVLQPPVELEVDGINILVAVGYDIAAVPDEQLADLLVWCDAVLERDPRHGFARLMADEWIPAILARQNARAA